MDILFLAHRVPFPPDRGDKIRGYHILRHLAARARVHLVAFADDPRDIGRASGLDPLLASRTVLPRRKGRAVALTEALASGRPLSLTSFADRALGRAVAERLKERPDAIYVFSGQMAQYLPGKGQTRIIMDFVDMDSAKFAAYADAAHGPMRWLMRREARLLGAFERRVAAQVDASLFVSAEEAALFRDMTGVAGAQVLENGIDTGFFDPAAAFARVEQAGPLIVFTGQMDYRPNIEAVAWFATDILPLIQAQVPEARFAIVGRAPVAPVRMLAQRPGVLVTGEVADVRGWLMVAACVVAPLRLARGIQNKVLEAMAMERAVVASTRAAEGIDHAGTLLTAGTAQAFASVVLDLIGNPDKAALLGRRARARTIERYGWEARLAPLDALLGLAANAAAEPVSA